MKLFSYIYKHNKIMLLKYKREYTWVFVDMHLEPTKKRSPLGGLIYRSIYDITFHKDRTFNNLVRNGNCILKRESQNMVDKTNLNIYLCYKFKYEEI